MKKIKTGKWSTLLAALVLTTGLSGVVQAADYTKGLTGVVDNDQPLLMGAGNTVSFDQKSNTMTYDFKGQDHTFTVTNSDGIGTNTEGDAYNYVFNNVDDQGKKGTLHIYQTNNRINDFAGVTGFSASTGHVTINSDLDITANSAYASMGVSAGNGADLVINGNVTMKKRDPNNPWGIITKNVHGNIGPGGATSMDPTDTNYTGARWQPSGFSVGYTRGNITVNGDVDIWVRGTAVKTDAYSGVKGVNPYDLASVSLLGDSIRIITPDNERKADGSYKEAYYSLASYGGTVNVNVKDMEAGRSHVKMVGNVIALRRSDRTDKPNVYQDGRVNIGLTQSDSSWHGVIDNAGKTQAGEVNVWLSNGAQWDHEAVSRTDGLDYTWMPAYSKPSYDNFDGVSYVNQLIGGKNESQSGFLSQNSEVKLHIANYSGYNTIIYKHEGNGTEKANYIGGDTTIVHAASGSGITLATGNNGIDLSDGDTVAKVLNALAGKLIYANYVKGESNLDGTVVIASGLTASSVTADVSGMITFDKETGAGTYRKPAQGEQTTNKIHSALTGTLEDTEYIKNPIRQSDGTYKFTLTPSAISVEHGAAIDAKARVQVEAEGNTLQLIGDTGIKSNGQNVTIKARNLQIGTYMAHVENGIIAQGGQVTVEGTGDINAMKEAIRAEKNSVVSMDNGAIKGDIISDGSTVTINKKGETTSVAGNLSVANGGVIDLTVYGWRENLTGDITKLAQGDAVAAAMGDDGIIRLTVADRSEWTGGHKDADAELHLTLSGGIWNNTGDSNAVIHQLSGGNKTLKTITYKDPKTHADVHIPVNGFIRMGEHVGDLTIDSYQGTHIISYGHDRDGSQEADYKGGATRIKSAKEGSLVLAATDTKGIRMSDSNAVEAALSGLSKKFFYEAGDTNLAGKAMIASGLTSSGVSRFIGDMTFGDDHQGQYKPGSLINVTGSYETAIMKGARAALTSSLMSWRSNADDLIYRGDLLRRNMEEDGLWARTYGGKDNFDATGVDISNQYWGMQVGYDKVYPEGVIAGVAVDYQTGNSNYSYLDDDFGTISGNTGKEKIYSMGFYGSKDLGNQDHFDLTVKAGSVGNDFTVYNGIGNELKGNYRNRAYSISSRYGKRFGSDKKYIEPQLQMTWSHVDANRFTAHSGEEELQIGQGSFDSVVGRIGVEAGRNGKYGTFYGKLDLAHEFKGAVRGTYYADDGGSKQTEVSMKDTWIEATMGTTLQLGENGTAYFDVSRTFGGEYEQEWIVNGGVRFAVGSGVTPSAKEVQKRSLAKATMAEEREEISRSQTKSTISETAPIPHVQLVPDKTTAGKTDVETQSAVYTASAADDTSYGSVETTYTAPAASTYQGESNGTPVFTLGQVVVTANRVPQPILEAKADLSIVSRDEIEALHMESIEDTLRTIPGVQFLNYGSNGLNANMSGIRINGSNDIIILVDGVRLNDFKGAGSSGYAFTSLLNNMDNVERVEVLRGSAAVMYGSGAKGGVINIITRKPTSNTASMDIARGSFGKEAYKFNAMGVKGKIRYQVYDDKSIEGSTKDASGKVWPGHSNTQSSGAKLQYDFNKDQNLSVSYDKTSSDFNGVDLIYKGHYVGAFDSERLTLKHDWNLSKLWNNTLVYRNSKEKYLWSKPGGEDPDMAQPVTGDTEYSLFSDTFRYKSATYTMVGGLEYVKGKDNNNGKDAKNTSMFLQGDWEFLPHLTLSGGVRHDSPKNFDSHNSFSYKLAWDITKKDSIYAGRSDYYILPSLSQLYDVKFGNKDLKASEGRTTSIGYNHEFGPENYLTFGWFETKVGVGLNIADDGTYQNVIGGIIRGWNAQYNVRLSRYVNAKLGWSHLYYDDSGSFSQGYAPKDKATFGIYYDKDKFGAAFDGFYFIRDTSRAEKGVKGWPSDKYAVCNLSLNYRANASTEFYLKVDNIFNKLWAEHTDVIWNKVPETWYAMPGRALTLGMKLRF